jgi:glycosyltransferase involved in cell wall biosynthesis
MRPLRIIQVLEATSGGTRRHLRELVTRLDPDRFSFHVLCATRRDGEFRHDIALFEGMGHRVTVLPMRREPDLLRDTTCALQLRRIFRRERGDLIHLHSAKAGFLGRIAALGLQCPVIYSPHAFPFLQDGLIGRLSGVAERILAPRTDVLHAVCDAEADLALATGLASAQRVCVIHNPVELRALISQLSDATAMPAPIGLRRIGLVGELRPQKDPWVFVRAARDLIERGVPVRFVLPARGELLLSVQDYVHRHRLDHAFEFVHTERTLAGIYRRSDVCVLPSRWEGHPYAMLDALALRRVLIASSLPVFTQTLRRFHDRLLFPVSDPNGLARCMEYWALCERNELVRVGSMGRGFVAREHRHDIWAEQMAALNLLTAQVEECEPAFGREPSRWDSVQSARMASL